MGFRGDITDYENCNMYLLIQKIQDHSTATVWTVLYLELLHAPRNAVHVHVPGGMHTL